MRSAEEKTNLQGAVSPPPHNALSPIGAGYATNSNGVGLMPPVTLPSSYICNNFRNCSEPVLNSYASGDPSHPESPDAT